MSARSVRVAAPTAQEWAVWWRAGDWNMLAPSIRHLALMRLVATTELDLDTAEDIAAIAVMRCWESATVPTNPHAFVTTVVHNLTADHFKSPSVAWRDSTGVDLELIESDAPSALVVLIASELDLWASMVDTLRRLFVMHCLTAPSPAKPVRATTLDVYAAVSRWLDIGPTQPYRVHLLAP